MKLADQGVLIADAIAEEAVRLLQSEVVVETRPEITPEQLLQTIGDFQALIIRGRTRVTGEIVAAADRLKIVGRAGVGVDNIDLRACERRGITVVNAPLSVTIAVAEHTIGLMLALVRQIPTSDAAMKAGGWPKKMGLGSELAGKTLGLVGIGRIGEAVAQRAAAFGMRVLAYDPQWTDEQIRARGAEPRLLQGMLAESDLLSIHTPLNAGTRHLIDATVLGFARPGMLLINTARGGVVDEQALLAALESGQVGGAGLDVFEDEPPGDQPLIRHPRVVATPHIGAQTAEAQLRAGMDIAREVLAALRGEPLRWQVQALAAG